MAKPVRAELLPPRYRLAVIEEPSGRIVARLPEIPGPAIARVARELARVLPALRAAAAVKEAVRGMFGDQTSTRPRRGGRA